MKLLNILLSQPQSELVDRIKALGISCNAHSRQQVTEELTKTLLSKEHIENDWLNMNDAERQLLIHMSYGSIFASYSINELFTCLKKSDRPYFKNTVNSLKNKGWLYREGTDTWLLPLELRNWIQHCLKEEFHQFFILFPKEETMMCHILNDLFEFMDYVSSKNIRLTKNKTIYKNELSSILNRLSKHEVIPNEQWRFGYGRHFPHYPDCFSLLYDFCLDQQWIEEEETLKVTEAWEKGQTISLGELLNRVLRFYIRLYGRAIPQLPFIVEVIKDVFPNQEGMEKRELAVILKNFIDPYYYDDSESIAYKRVIQMLEYIHVLLPRHLDGLDYVVLNPRYKNESKKIKKI